MNFFRDRDANSNVFDDPRNDPTAGTPTTSPRKKQKISNVIEPSSSKAAEDDAALESLRKRMAGPSSGKAGLGMDQDKINRTIYEVSKGSKFFENERKKDAQTTERIKALLARRDEKLRQTPPGSLQWLSIERRIEELSTSLENSRDLSRVILHTDIDMFYAAVELARDPSLKGKCFGVGSGVLVTASYEARRGFGVRSGMATFVAKALCPHLIVVKNDMASYVEASQKVMAVFEQYDENLAKASLDEAYLDITDYVEQEGGTVEDVVERLRAQVKEQTQLTVSVGIAPNMMLAKISSDRNKPDGQFRVMDDRKTIINFMDSLPCRKIPGIGRVNERILESLGVRTCGEIWHKRVELWLALDGKIDWLLKAYLGIGNTVVEPGKREERKSVGREHTFSPTSDVTELLDLLRQSADRVEQDLNRLEFKARTVTLSAKRDNFQRFSRAKSGTKLVHTADELYEITSNLLMQELEREGTLCLRLIGVRVTHLVDLRSSAAGQDRLKKLFQNAADELPEPSGAAVRKPRRTAQDLINEEEQQLALAIRQSLEANPLDPFSDVQDLSQDTPVPSEDGSGPADSSLRADKHATVVQEEVQCPICQQALKGSNQEVNRHVDACLNASALPNVAPSRASSAVTPQATTRKGPLDVFVRRSRN